MYFLTYLSQASSEEPEIEVDYRIAVSGEFYNRTVQTFDWRKSDATRILLDRSFHIFVTSRPFDAYPQELSVRLLARSGRRGPSFCGAQATTPIPN